MQSPAESAGNIAEQEIHEVLGLKQTEISEWLKEEVERLFKTCPQVRIICGSCFPLEEGYGQKSSAILLSFTLSVREDVDQVEKVQLAGLTVQFLQSSKKINAENFSSSEEISYPFLVTKDHRKLKQKILTATNALVGFLPQLFCKSGPNFYPCN